MSLVWLIYLADVCDIFKTIFIISAFALLGISGMAFLGAYGNNELTKYIKIFKTMGIIICTCAIVSILTPSKDTIYMMIGVNYAEQLSKSEIGNKVYQLLDSKLDEAISDTKNKLKGDKKGDNNE